MADLLECLLQIKGLAETPPRLEAMLAATTPSKWTERPDPEVWAPVEIAAHLADQELVYGVRLRLMLTSERPALEVLDQARLAARAGYLGWVPELAVRRFATRRGETLELLESCSAAELERVGRHPARGDMTVADLVALMLAHDVDHCGQIRQRLGLAEPEEAFRDGDNT
jgi:hypothetical protein